MGTAWQAYDYDLLTTIAYFSVEATATGGLSNLHGWPPTDLINYAHARGVAVVLCVTLFNRDDLNTLLGNPTYRQNLIDNLLAQVQAGNADGINVDFESLPAAQKQNMVRFITDLADALHTARPGSQITLAMPAVDWNDAWDYDALATASDGLFIMGYDYHWRGSSTTGAVAPLAGGTYNITWTVNDYLTKTGGRADKLILGCPYYGYEWPATGSQPGAATTGDGTARRYSTAEPLAQSYGKRWDSASQTPWYRYQNPGWFQCWYDDSLSLSRKYTFARERNLQGIGIWALGYDGSRPELWQALDRQFGAGGVPATPEDFALSNAGDGTVRVSFTGVPGAERYLLLREYADSPGLDTLGVYNAQPILLDNLTIGEEYYLRLAAANDNGSSPPTEMLGVVPTTTTPKVLIVNGFDRVAGTHNTFDFIRQHGAAVAATGYAFDAAANEAVIRGTVNLQDYAVVDWILGEEGTATSAFDATEQARVAAFLENGGQLFVSGSEIGYDLIAQGTVEDQQFYTEYLKARYVSDAAGGQQGVYRAFGTEGSILAGVGGFDFDDGSHGTYDVDWPDGIKPAGGSLVCAQYTGVDFDSRGGAGVYFSGRFGDGARDGSLVYLAVGFETIYPAEKRWEVMAAVLDFFKQTRSGEESPPLVFNITGIYPNPTRGTVHFVLDLPEENFRTPRFRIVNLLGRTVFDTRLPGGITGSHTWTWSGIAADGRRVGSGIYIAVLSIDRQQRTRKFTVVK
jgi:spore germination protein YaaH